MFSTTQNLVYDVNRENGQLTNLLHFNRCQFRTNLTCESMQTSSARCSRPDDSTNTSSASRMPSQNTQWSRPWRTKKRRPWRKPFSQNGFVNSASLRRFTQTAGRSLSTNFQMSDSPYSMLITQRQLRPILSATRRLKFLTKQLRST